MIAVEVDRVRRAIGEVLEAVSILDDAERARVLRAARILCNVPIATPAQRPQAAKDARKIVVESISDWLRGRAHLFREADGENSITTLANDLLNGEWEEDTAGGALKP